MFGEVRSVGVFGNPEWSGSDVLLALLVDDEQLPVRSSNTFILHYRLSHRRPWSGILSLACPPVPVDGDDFYATDRQHEAFWARSLAVNAAAQA